MNISNQTEDTLRAIFRRSLEERGVEPDTIEVKCWNSTTVGTQYGVRIAKEINCELKEFKFSIDAESSIARDPDKLEAEIEHAAREIANELEDAVVDTIEVCGTRLRFCVAEGGWVECERCDERVSLDSIQSSTPSISLSEDSPAPSTTSPYEVRKYLQRIDSDKQEILKLYMLGALRNYCSCRFGKLDHTYRKI